MAQLQKRPHIRLKSCSGCAKAFRQARPRFAFAMSSYVKVFGLAARAHRTKPSPGHISGRVGETGLRPWRHMAASIGRQTRPASLSGPRVTSLSQAYDLLRTFELRNRWGKSATAGLGE